MQRALYLELYFRSAIGNCVNDSASLSVIFAHARVHVARSFVGESSRSCLTRLPFHLA